MPDLIGAGSVANVLPIPTQELEATYYDTVDRRLARWGITLRHRTADGDHAAWTLKLPVPAADVAGVTPASRDEMEIEGGPDAIPEVLVDLVTAHIRSHPLTPAAVLATTAGRVAARCRRRSRCGGADERRRVGDGGRGRSVAVQRARARGTSRRLPMTWRPSPTASSRRARLAPSRSRRWSGPWARPPLDRRTWWFPSSGPMTPRAGPSERRWPMACCGSSATIPGPGWDPRRTSTSSGSACAVCAAICGCSNRCSAPRGPPDSTPTSVHSPTGSGDVRDLDVLMARVESAHGDLGTALGPMVADLHQRHTTARAGLLDELRSDRYAQLLERLVVLARDPELSPAGRAPSGEALPTPGGPGLAATRAAGRRAHAVLDR